MTSNASVPQAAYPSPICTSAGCPHVGPRLSEVRLKGRAVDEPYAVFQPGGIVHAADRNNFGHVIEDDGGPKVHVRFRNPGTRKKAEPWIDRSLLTLARDSA